ncbi:MFS transporter [Krasilnikoviella flava]|uniref:Nitrate/nitrite transporter NarK n=1 Tax=Krasilnikoviella flava TaxID=526729 RepID=A0A1T5JHL4_9MICO|nr:MFS transporter [Krasilnikoviella flava]SKC50692.1 Nitrate/nitrite transporter NarK [Krasilnikoviella flava]
MTAATGAGTDVDGVALARNASFRRLWLGEGVSVLGNATTSVLLPLVAVLELDAGAIVVGVLTAAAWLPWLVVGLPAGAWVDRLPARRVMIVADLVAAAAIGSVPVATALDALTLPHLVGAALAAGVTSVFFRTAYAVLLPQVVPGPQLEAANARLLGTESAMQVAGPGLGGVMAQALGAALGLVLDAVSFVVSAVCLWRVRTTSAPERPPAAPLRVRIREGVAFVASDRYLRWFVVVGGISNFGLTGYGALLVLFLVDTVGLGPSALGVVMTVGACGGLLGATVATWLSGRLGSARATMLLIAAGGPPALLVGLGGDGGRVAWTVAGLFLVGLAVVAGNVLRGAWRQRYVPQPLMGRVVTTSQFVNFGTMPLAALAAGALGELVGVRETMLLMAAVHCLACLSALRSPLRGMRDMPGPRVLTPSR